ncbi:hypothetical protein VTK73DRAFT_1760 [Phialemonium thermophilum]|uniref:Uncharacterized protein n=1 Tax=Phialemonium thermophilum TaxID=223376 RepID=A0ABR3X7U5_9PEZI
MSPQTPQPGGAEHGPVSEHPPTATTTDNDDDELSRVTAAEALGLLKANIENILRTPGGSGETKLTQEREADRNAFPLLHPPTPQSPRDELLEAVLELPDGIHLRTSTRGPNFGMVLAHPRKEYAAQPLSPEMKGGIMRVFAKGSVPAVSVAMYLDRLFDHCSMPAMVYVAAGRYLRRLLLVERTTSLTRHNVHRLVLAALYVAHRIVSDQFHTDEWVATVGGISRPELTQLWVNFCVLLSFRLFVWRADLEEELRNLRTGWLAES